MNVVLLWGEAQEHGYSAPIWMTYKQAQEFGGQVRKGEHGSLVVYANSITRTETNDQGRGHRARNSVHEGLHRFQRRADRRRCPRIITRSR